MVLENVENIKCLGVTITNDLRWNTHVSNVCTKANRTLCFLRQNPYACPQEVKEAAYKGLVGASSPGIQWFYLGPLGCRPSEWPRKSQNRAARFVTGNYNFYTFLELLYISWTESLFYAISVTRAHSRTSWIGAGMHFHFINICLCCFENRCMCIHCLWLKQWIFLSVCYF